MRHPWRTTDAVAPHDEEDLANAGVGADPQRIQRQLPSEFHRWARAAGLSAADMERLFGGQVGGGYTRGAFRRVSQRSDGRYTGKSTYQCRQDHRALSPTVVRKARNRGHG